MSEFRALKCELLRLDRERRHLDFLTTCRDVGLIPKFLVSRSKYISKFHPKVKFDFEMKCLKSIIRGKHALVNSITKKIYGYRNDGLYRRFANYAVNGVFDRSMMIINEFREQQNTEIEKRHAKKIESLSAGIKTITPCKTVDFINLSKHVFTERQKIFLNKGPKYIHPSRIKPIDYIPQLEDIIRNVDPVKKEEVRCHLFLAYSKHLKSTCRQVYEEDKIIRSIKEIPDLVFMSTDKSNRIAVMDKLEYIQKMKDTIQTLDCTAVPNDPLPSLMYKTTKVAKDFNTSEWPEDIRKIARINPLGVIPKMFAALKDHKQNNPLRPIVRRCSAPTFYIEKTLVNVLKELLPVSEHVLSSTADFIHRLNNIQLPNNFIMFSLDIISLYPSIDMNKASISVSHQLNLNTNLSVHMKNTILSAFNLVIQSNYFVFDGQIYFQNLGAPMGSPISGLAAEFILRPLEQKFLEDYTTKPICWLRFVDDIFGIWPSSQASLMNFFQELNNQDQRIKFTIELEKNHQLTFLDVSLKKENGSITRTVHRKPMNTNCTIPKTANAPKIYKQAAYRSYVKRAMVICTPDTIHQELNNIRKIAVQNGFSLNFINDIVKDISRPIQHPPSSIKKINRIPIQYIKGLHEKISSIVKPYNIQLIAKTGQKLKDKLKTKLDPLPIMMTPGVYEIPILHADNNITHYIGQTSRKLNIRIKEHKNDLRHGKLTSAICRAVADDPSIKVLFDDAHIIAPFTTQSKTILRESLEIFIRGNKVCNDQDSFTIPKIWLTILQ